MANDKNIPSYLITLWDLLIYDEIVKTQRHQWQDPGGEELEVAVEYDVALVLVEGRGLDLQRGGGGGGRVQPAIDRLEIQKLGQVRQERNRGHNQCAGTDARS